MMRAVNWAVGLAFMLYLAIGVCGYGLFGEETRSNLLLNFSDDFLASQPQLRAPLLAAKASMGLALLLTCPIALWPFRSCVLSVLLRHQNGGRQTPSHEASRASFLLVTVASEASILACALYLPDVKTPLSLVGSVSGSLIIFILPSLFYASLQRRRGLPFRCLKGPIAMVALGVLVGTLGFSLTLLKISRGE
jgi:amino acid permease